MDDLSGLADRISALEDEFRSLSDEMSAVSKRLRDGRPPNADILQRASAAATDYREILGRIEQVLQCHYDVDSPPQLAALRDEVTAYLQLSLRQSLEAVEELLRRVLTFEHEEEGEFQPLRTAQAEATTLLNDLAALKLTNTESTDLAEKSRPLAKLDLLVCSGGTLSDDDVVSASEIVAESYGRLLAVAAMRGKIVIGRGGTQESGDVVDQIQEAGGDDKDSSFAAAGSDAEIEHSKDELPEQKADITTDSEKGDAEEPGEPLTQTSEEEPEITEDSKPQADDDFGHEDRSDIEDSDSDAIWSLLIEGRLGVAAALAGILERTSDDLPPIPAKCIQAALFAGHIIVRDGNLAEATRKISFRILERGLIFCD